MKALTGETAYLFRHAVMREAAYQLQLPTSRSQLHGLALEILEALIPESDRARAALELADHARAASGSPKDSFSQKESRYLQIAGEEEQRAWRLPAAIQLMLRAAEHPATSPEQKYRSLRLAAGLWTDMGQPQKAELLMEQAQAIAGLPEDRLRRVQAGIDSGRIAYVAGRHEQSLQLLIQARQEAEQAGDLNLLRDALSCLSSANDFLGRLEDALAAAIAALDIAKAQGNAAVIHRDTGNIGTLLARLGRLQEAESCMVEAIAGHQASGHMRFEAIVAGNMSLVQDMLGRPQAALDWQKEALACMRRLGDGPSQGYMLGNLADLLRKQGRLHGALAALQRGSEHLRESGLRNAELVLRRNLGLLWLVQGRRDHAQEMADSVRVAVKDFDPAFRVRAQARLDFNLALSEPQHDLDLARHILTAAEDTCRQAGTHENSETGQELLRMRGALEYCQAGLAAHPGQWPLFRGASPRSMTPPERLAHWLRLNVLHPDQAETLAQTQPALTAAMQEGTDNLAPPDWRDATFE